MNKTPYDQFGKTRPVSQNLHNSIYVKFVSWKPFRKALNKTRYILLTSSIFRLHFCRPLAPFHSSPINQMPVSLYFIKPRTYMPTQVPTGSNRRSINPFALDCPTRYKRTINAPRSTVVRSKNLSTPLSTPKVLQTTSPVHRTSPR